MLFLKCLCEFLRQQIVEIVTSQAIVAMARQHLRDIAFHGNDGNVESPTSQVIDQSRMTRSIAVAIGEARGGGLIQNSDDL